MVLSFILQLWQVLTVKVDLVILGVEAGMMIRRFLHYLPSRRRRCRRPTRGARPVTQGRP